MDTNACWQQQCFKVPVHRHSDKSSGTYEIPMKLLDLPSCVLEYIFIVILGSPNAHVVSGRALERCISAFNLAITSKRLLGIYRSSFKVLRLDGFEAPLLDGGRKLSSFLHFCQPNVKRLSVKWFENAAIPACFDVVQTGFHSLEELSIHGLACREAAPALISLLENIGSRLKRISLVSLSWFDDFGSKADDTLTVLSKNCKKLQSVELRNARGVSHFALVSLWEATASRIVTVELHNLGHFSLGDHTLLAMVRNCPNIHTLGISNMAGTTRQGLLNTCVSLSDSLSDLRFETHRLDSASLNDETACAIVKNCRSLDRISFSKPMLLAPALYGDPLSHESTRYTYMNLGEGLKQLNIFGQPGFCDGHLVEMSECCANLRAIGIRSCSGVTSAGFSAFLEKAGHRLQRIDISGSGLIDDVGVASIGRNCQKSLEVLWASELPSVTILGFVALLSGVGACLRDINFSKNPEVDGLRVAQALRAHCSGPRLENAVLDDMTGDDGQYELSRHFREGDASSFHAELEKLRNACPNAIIVLEASFADLPELVDVSDFSEEGMNFTQGAEAFPTSNSHGLNEDLNVSSEVNSEMLEEF